MRGRALKGAGALKTDNTVLTLSCLNFPNVFIGDSSNFFHDVCIAAYMYAKSYYAIHIGQITAFLGCQGKLFTQSYSD